MKKVKAFTLYELVLVVAILGILMGIAIPSLLPATNFANKNKVNTMHKVCISAIDSWIRANYDPIQRPDNFNSRNSQGVAVYEYIKSKEIFSMSNLEIDKMQDFLRQKDQEIGKVYITFNNGVLKTTYAASQAEIDDQKPELQIVHGVFELDEEENIMYYEEKKFLNYIVGYLKNNSLDPVRSNISPYSEVTTH